MHTRKPAFYRKPGGNYIRPSYTLEWLQGLARITPNDFTGKSPPSYVNGKVYGLSLLILQHCFGMEWLEKYVLIESKTSFLSVEISRGLTTEEAAARVMTRIRFLAEMIVNLINDYHIEGCLNAIAGGQIESAFAELEVGWLLRVRGISFHFNRPIGIKGQDYDLLVKYPVGNLSCAEIKSPMEFSDFDPKKIEERLREAKKRNLPKDKPGTIFIKVPQKWLTDKDIEAQIASICGGIFRNSQRIVGIVAFSHIIEFTDNLINAHFEITAFENDTHQYAPGALWDLFGIKTLGAVKSTWINLNALCLDVRSEKFPKD